MATREARRTVRAGSFARDLQPCWRYLPIVRRAYQLWHELESASPASALLTITGGLMMGPEEREGAASGVLRSAGGA